jgi:hypothetical protein
MYLVSDKLVKWRSPTGKVFSSETCRTMVVRSYRANRAIDQWCLTARISSNHMRKMRGSVLRPKASVSKCAKQGTASANHCHNTLFVGVFGIYPNQERAAFPKWNVARVWSCCTAVLIHLLCTCIENRRCVPDSVAGSSLCVTDALCSHRNWTTPAEVWRACLYVSV